MTDLVATELSTELRITTMRLARRLRATHGAAELTASQLAALSSLDRHGPLTPSALAACERVQPPSMTRLVAGLEERGLLSRAGHPDDRRQTLLEATDLGRSVIADVRRRSDLWLAERLGALSPDDVAALAAALPVLDRLATA